MRWRLRKFRFVFLLLGSLVTGIIWSNPARFNWQWPTIPELGARLLRQQVVPTPQGYLLHWCMGTGDYAADAITEVLADFEGWGQAGLTFERSDCGPGVVVIDVVLRREMPAFAYGIVSPGSIGWWEPGHILLAEEYIGIPRHWRYMVEHEMGHELCLGHEGYGIMSPGLIARPGPFEVKLVVERVGRGTTGIARCPTIKGIR